MCWKVANRRRVIGFANKWRETATLSLLWNKTETYFFRDGCCPEPQEETNEVIYRKVCEFGTPGVRNQVTDFDVSDCDSGRWIWKLSLGQKREYKLHRYLPNIWKIVPLQWSWSFFLHWVNVLCGGMRLRKNCFCDRAKVDSVCPWTAHSLKLCKQVLRITWCVLQKVGWICVGNGGASISHHCNDMCCIHDVAYAAVAKIW